MMIDKEQWSTLPADVKGGPGDSAQASCFALPPASMQSFTLRPLIQAMVEVMQPDVRGHANAVGGMEKGRPEAAKLAWTMPEVTKSNGTMVDPACGQKCINLLIIKRKK